MYVVRYFPQAKTLGVICLRYKVIRCSVFTMSSQMAHNYFAEARLLTKCEKSGAVELEGGRGGRGVTPAWIFRPLGGFASGSTDTDATSFLLWPLVIWHQCGNKSSELKNQNGREREITSKMSKKSCISIISVLPFPCFQLWNVWMFQGFETPGWPEQGLEERGHPILTRPTR